MSDRGKYSYLNLNFGGVLIDVVIHSGILDDDEMNAVDDGQWDMYFIPGLISKSLCIVRFTMGRSNRRCTCLHMLLIPHQHSPKEYCRWRVAFKIQIQRKQSHHASNDDNGGISFLWQWFFEIAWRLFWRVTQFFGSSCLFFFGCCWLLWWSSFFLTSRLQKTDEECKKLVKEWSELSGAFKLLVDVLGAIDGWLAYMEKPFDQPSPLDFFWSLPAIWS